MVDTKTASKETGIPRKVITDWIASGEFRDDSLIKPSRKYYFKLKAFKGWLETKKVFNQPSLKTKTR